MRNEYRHKIQTTLTFSFQSFGNLKKAVEIKQTKEKLGFEKYQIQIFGI